jgi:hypothetical protein
MAAGDLFFRPSKNSGGFIKGVASRGTIGVGCHENHAHIEYAWGVCVLNELPFHSSTQHLSWELHVFVPPLWEWFENVKTQMV